MLFKKKRNGIESNWGASLALFVAISLFSAPAAQAQGQKGVVKSVADAAGKAVEGLFNYWRRSEAGVLTTGVTREAFFSGSQAPTFRVIASDRRTPVVWIEDQAHYFAGLSELTTAARDKIRNGLKSKSGTAVKSLNTLTVEEEVGTGIVHVRVQILASQVDDVISHYRSIEKGPTVETTSVSIGGYDEVKFSFNNPNGSAQSEILTDWGL